MGKIALLLMIISSFSILSSCSLNGNPSETATDDVSYDFSDTGNNVSSINQNDTDGDTFLVSCIPEEFYINGKYFVVKKEVELDNDDVNDFFGYFINKEDLEKWKSYDKLENITYVIDEDNSIYHYDLTGKLTNRFELFLTRNINEIALKAHGSYSVYKLIEDKEE